MYTGLANKSQILAVGIEIQSTNVNSTCPWHLVFFFLGDLVNYSKHDRIMYTMLISFKRFIAS